MRTTTCLAIVLIGLFGVSAMSEQANAMPDNQASLRKAHTRIQEFEAKPEAERLREASLALSDVNLLQEQDVRIRSQVREDCLWGWLRLVDLVDRSIDPKFDPKDLPETTVQPPPTSKGVVYPPGADPALIDDPGARAEYEKARNAGRIKAERYRLQTELRRVSERIADLTSAFIRKNYSADNHDQQELKSAIEEIIKLPERKAELLKLRSEKR